MRATQTVLVCGVPGVGKSTLIRATIARLPDTDFYEADELVSTARAAEITEIRASSAAHRVARYFQLLEREFTARREQSDKRVLMLETASVIETEAGWFEPPLHILKALAPCALVHIEDDCERIAGRCFRDRYRVRLTRSAIELARYQDRSLRACERKAERLGCAVHWVRADAFDEFMRLIQSI